MTLVDDCRRQIPAVCARYGLPPPATITQLSGGSANLNFVLRFGEGGPAAVKATFCLYKDLAGARRVAQLLAALGNAPIGRLIGGPDDVAEAGGRPVLLTRFVEGTPLATVDRFVALEIGRLLARLHRPPPPEAPIHDMHPARLAGIAAGDEGPVDADFAAFVLDALDCAGDHPSLPEALIHGDLFPDNIIRGPDGGLSAIDFEEACRGPRVFDLAMTIIGLSPAGQMDAGVVTGLVSGFTFEAPLTKAEARALPGLVAQAAAAIAAWRLVGTPAEMAEHVRDWREMLPIVETVRAWSRNGIWRAITGPLHTA